MSSEAAKKARLAEALRANLRRRKAQARATPADDNASPNPTPLNKQDQPDSE